MQNQNIAHYPTPILRQLDLSPWAEFVILQLQILTDGDRLANLVQWFSMMGSLIGVSLIAKQLEANTSGQVLSSIVCITIPMGILQASSTQNDYVVAFWLVCFAYNVLLAINRRVEIRTALELGASLGLAVLTKTTAYLYAFPFCIVLAVGLLHQFHWKAWKPSLSIAVPFFLINIGFWWRNLALFNSPFGVTCKQVNCTNKLLTLPGFISNLVRNIALHLATPYQPLNDAMEGAIIWLHQAMGLNIADPRTTFLEEKFQIPIGSKTIPLLLHEDISGNLIHLLLILGSLFLCFRYAKLRTSLRIYYLIALLGTLICFCLLLTWQPWASRLHLPFFVLFSPFIGTLFVQAFSPKLIHYFLVTTLALSAMPYLLFNASRPLALSKHFTILTSETILVADRFSQYFASRPDLKESYIEAGSFISSQKCSEIGLYIGGNSWEYPFWVLAKMPPLSFSRKPIRFQHVKTDNASAVSIASQPSRQFVPCAVISLETKPNLVIEVPVFQTAKTKGLYYKRVQTFGSLQIYQEQKI